MATRSTDVLVIGGGMTGAGVLRDLAMRGIRAILVERDDFASGTTGRYHGLLHSGGRYVVKDPVSARDCALENAILRRILPGCIEDTGGYFVVTPVGPARICRPIRRRVPGAGGPVRGGAGARGAAPRAAAESAASAAPSRCPTPPPTPSSASA